jgi:DNA-directed RNA polymerase specialized sigma24 family protein
MSPTSRKRHVGLVEQLTAEWKVTGRAGPAVRSLHTVARRDEGLALLVFGPDAAKPDAQKRGHGIAPPCRTPCDVVDHLRRASGRVEREEAARLISVLLRESDRDPFLSRLLVQALLPGLIGVAGKLRWGKGGDWRDTDEFFGELLETAWLVLQEWAGQDRPYAVLDLLSAIRCRMRRQLFRAKDRGGRTIPLSAETDEGSRDRAETDLEELTRILIERHHGGMCPEEVQVLYANSVLGYSITELATMTGRDRRVLYARRHRGRHHLCA